ncbi:hypothetical protein EDB84DRAFT_1458983 [Lactarius hengduanensis]|nr:hypothetical protein EDB84DRAFT_1458983 [Lactarius hengduanensis]
MQSTRPCMCTLWKASATKKAVRVASTRPAHPFFRNVDWGLGWGSAAQTPGRIRDDMSGPGDLGTLLLGNSHAIAEPSCRVLVTEWGSLLCGGTLVFFPHIKQLDCFPMLLVLNGVREDILSDGNECAPKILTLLSSRFTLFFFMLCVALPVLIHFPLV